MFWLGFRNGLAMSMIFWGPALAYAVWRWVL